MSEQPPDWFLSAIAEPHDSRVVEVEGARIHYRAWGKPGERVVVLVHGGAAHSGWWDHIGPHISAGHRIVALDLSGHGDSERRDDYSLETWAGEVLAVAAAEGAVLPIVFGHSMGGFVALMAAKLFGAQLGGALAIDSPVQESSAEMKAWRAEGKKLPEHKVRPTREGIMARFRTLPSDDSSLEYIRAHIAAGSVCEAEGGWIWKFDPNIFFHSHMAPEDLATARCPVALIRGERGMATTDITDDVARRLGGHVPVTVIPDAGHHIMLEQPIALIAVLQTLIGQWDQPAQWRKSDAQRRENEGSRP